MLISFSVTNFKSIKNEQTIDMEVDSKFHTDSKNKQYKNNFFKINALDNLKLLKSSAIYGANASGKSNFIEAVANFYFHIFSKKNNRGDSIEKYYPFAESSDSTFFEIEFTIEGKKYNYQYSFDNTRIHYEKLSIFNKSKGKIKNRIVEKKLYELKFNKKDDKYEANFKNFKGDYKKSLEIFKTTQNNLFLNLNINDDGNNFLKEIYDYFRDNYIILRYVDFEEAVEYAKKNKTQILDILKNIDLGIDDFIIEKEIISIQHIKNFPDYINVEKFKEIIGEGEEYPKIKFKQKAGFTLNQNQISDGTKSIFSSLPYILPILSKGGAIFIDELDENLHPDLLLYIVRMFHNPKINKANGQLIFTAHNDILLEKKEDIFRRDQIWFTSKIDKTGETDLYPLSDFNVKSRDNIVKEYRYGTYGAKPFLKYCE